MTQNGNGGDGHLSGRDSGSATVKPTKASNQKGKEGKSKGAMSAKLQGAGLSFAKKHPKLTRAGKVAGIGIAGYATIGTVNTAVRMVRGSSFKSAAKQSFGFGALDIE